MMPQRPSCSRANAVAERISMAYGLFLLPPVTISCSHEHEGLPAGAVSISARIPAAIVDDVRRALAAIGSWSDLEGEEALATLDRIRHESEPSPPLDLER